MNIPDKRVFRTDRIWSINLAATVECHIKLRKTRETWEYCESSNVKLRQMAAAGRFLRAHATRTISTGSCCHGDRHRNRVQQEFRGWCNKAGLGNGKEEGNLNIEYLVRIVLLFMKYRSRSKWHNDGFYPLCVCVQWLPNQRVFSGIKKNRKLFMLNIACVMK